MPSSRGGRSGASSSKSKHSQQARDEVYGWFQAMMPPGSEKIPNYRALVLRLVDEALERGFSSSSLTRENWQVVLYEGTIRMIQGDPTPSAASAGEDSFTPPVWTPSRKRALSSSSDQYTLPDFSQSSLDPLTAGNPVPMLKKARWGDEPPATPSPFPPRTATSGAPVLGLISTVQNGIANLAGVSSPASGSLAAHLDAASLAQLYFLLGVSPEAVEKSIAADLAPRLPFAGPTCPRCLPDSIYHAVGTKCPLSKSVRFTPEPTPGHPAQAVQSAGHSHKPKPDSYAAAAASGVSPTPTVVGPKKPSSVTRALRRCTRQGTKTTKVIFRPPPDSGLPPSIPAIKTAFQGFQPPLKSAEFTLRRDVVLTFGETLSDEVRQRASARIAPLFSGGGGEVLNRGTTALLKFPLVPTHLPDGSAVSADQLHGYLLAHPKWKAASFIQPARFITPKNKKLGLSATVIVEISDDRSSSVARRLLQTDISFGGAIRRAQPWSLKRPSSQCGICLKWGHSSHRCKSKTVWCARCAGNHDTVSHDLVVNTAAPLPLLCVNCKGVHSAVSRECPFFLARFDPKKLTALQETRRERILTARTAKKTKKRKETSEVEEMLFD